jgi:hypothetical protein
MRGYDEDLEKFSDYILGFLKDAFIVRSSCLRVVLSSMAMRKRQLRRVVG